MLFALLPLPRRTLPTDLTTGTCQAALYCHSAALVCPPPPCSLPCPAPHAHHPPVTLTRTPIPPPPYRPSHSTTTAWRGRFNPTPFTVQAGRSGPALRKDVLPAWTAAVADGNIEHERIRDGLPTLRRRCPTTFTRRLRLARRTTRWRLRGHACFLFVCLPQPVFAHRPVRRTDQFNAPLPDARVAWPPAQPTPFTFY